MRVLSRLTTGLVAAGLLLTCLTTAPAAELDALIAKLKAVDHKAQGSRTARDAWQELVQADASKLPAILKALEGANPLAANYIRSAADAIAERTLESGGKLPAERLEKFVLDTENSPRARRTAFEWLTRIDPSTPDRLIPGMLHDPGVEFRRDAVARLIEQAQEDKESATAIYEKAFEAARDLDQVKLLAERLKDAGVEVKLARHFGFITRWQLVGPFDNADGKGFLVAYPPEVEIEPGATYEGKDNKEVEWFEHTTADDYGKVDLNEVLGKFKGAVAYGVATFDSDEERRVQFRLSSVCATRLWLNGELIDSHEVYHSGQSFDQYVSEGVLKEGRNVILLKVCQNEQTQSWAQDWEFQLRISDATGTAVLSEDRPADK